jgi:two-component system CheB/CheR fusion protein
MPREPDDPATGAGEDEQFEVLLEFLRDNRGFDFTGYKRASLHRRISRRMQRLDIASFSDYVDYLQFHADEFTELFDTILINVTSFFRDPESWVHLRSDVLPELLEAKRASQPIRVWSAGAASGEEAYTVAMLLAEELGAQQFRDRVKIYATDVDEQALAEARQAVYSAKQVAAVPDDLSGRYFEEINGGYAFRKDLRRSVIFGRNDLIQDAPISRVDLLICRNTLMYFNAETQDRVLRRFHFALTEAGVLFLGKAETLLSRSRLFRPLDARRRFFGRLAGTVPAEVTGTPAGQPTEQPGADGNLLFHAFELLPDATMIIGENGRLVHFNRRAATMFLLTDGDLGKPFRELDASLRPVDLRPLLDRLAREPVPVTVRDVEWHRGAEGPNRVDINIHALPGDGGGRGALIFFTDVSTSYRLQQDLTFVNNQLETSYEELQSTVEELETTNAELQSTVEELETTNEELQSTNEELETTNEELQSTNDELQSANEELSERSAEVAASNSFMDTILRSLDTGVVVVDPTLKVSSWSERVEDLWGVRSDEALGQRFDALDIGLPVAQIVPAVRAVLAGGEPQVVLLDAVNRRGRDTRVRIRCTALSHTDGGRTGAILLMEEDPPDSGPG